MVYDIFTNISIVVAFLLAVGQVFKGSLFDTKQTLKIQALLGLSFGILGTILMVFTIEIMSSIIVDLRNISIICAGVMGGPLAAAFAAVIIAISRLILFGIDAVSVTAFFTSLVVGLGTAYISSMKRPRVYKFLWMFLYTMLISNIVLMYLIKNHNKFLETLTYYWPTYIFGAVLAYFTCEYIISASSNYNTMSYYRVTADNLLDVISTHKPGGIIKFASPSIFQLSGYTPEEFTGTSAYKYIHPDDAGTIKRVFSNFNEEEGNSTQIYRLKRKDGTYVWVETSVTARKNDDGDIKELICVTRDISMRKEIEQELKLSNARLKAIFDNAATGIVLRDCNGGLIDANPAYLEMIGYSKEEVGQLSKIVHPDDYKEVQTVVDDLVSGKCSSYRLETRYIGKDRQIIYADVTSAYIPGTDHTPASIIRVVNNITERKKMEEELMRAKEEADKLAATDYLTGILNRRAFAERYKEEFHRAMRENSSICLILADIDHFKEVNDIHGHSVGDLVLKKFTKCVTNVCRSYDFIGRLGGEEFIICLPNTRCEQGEKIAERIRREVEKEAISLLYLKDPIKITASFGVASCVPDGAEIADMLLVKADDAMYKAKEAGRNKVIAACGD